MNRIGRSKFARNSMENHRDRKWNRMKLIPVSQICKNDSCLIRMVWCVILTVIRLLLPTTARSNLSIVAPFRLTTTAQSNLPITAPFHLTTTAESIFSIAAPFWLTVRIVFPPHFLAIHNYFSIAFPGYSWLSFHRISMLFMIVFSSDFLVIYDCLSRSSDAALVIQCNIQRYCYQLADIYLKETSETIFCIAECISIIKTYQHQSYVMMIRSSD